MIERSVGTWKMDVADYGGRSRPAWTKLYVFVCLSETFVLEVEMLNRSYLDNPSLELEERFLDWSRDGDRSRDDLTRGRGRCLCCGIHIESCFFSLQKYSCLTLFLPQLIEKLRITCCSESRALVGTEHPEVEAMVMARWGASRSSWATCSTLATKIATEPPRWRAGSLAG